PAGRTGCVEQFAEYAAAEVGENAELVTVTALTVPDAVDVASTPGPDADSIAGADVVVVETGFNSALPDPESGIGCSTWFLDTEPGCLAEGVATYGDLYDQVFAAVKALRGDRPTVYIATTTVNGNLAPA